MTIRAEQINLSNYYTSTQVDNISGSLKTYIDIASGALNTKISTASGALYNQIIATSGYIISTISGYSSGVTDHGLLTGLSDDDHSGIYYNKATINNMSGALYSGYISAVNTLSGNLVTSYTSADSTLSGNLMTKLNTYSGLLYSGYVAADSTLSGYYAWKLNTLTLDNLSGVTCPSPTSGQLLRYNGTDWVNATVSSSSTPSFMSIYTRPNPTSSQSISEASYVAFTNTIHNNTSYFTHSDSTDNTKIVVLNSGYYLVGGNITVQAIGDYMEGWLRAGGNNISGGYRKTFTALDYSNLIWADVIVNLPANAEFQVYVNAHAYTGSHLIHGDKSSMSLTYLGT